MNWRLSLACVTLLTMHRNRQATRTCTRHFTSPWSQTLMNWINLVSNHNWLKGTTNAVGRIESLVEFCGQIIFLFNAQLTDNFSFQCTIDSPIYGWCQANGHFGSTWPGLIAELIETLVENGVFSTGSPDPAQERDPDHAILETIPNQAATQYVPVKTLFQQSVCKHFLPHEVGGGVSFRWNPCGSKSFFPKLHVLACKMCVLYTDVCNKRHATTTQTEAAIDCPFFRFCSETLQRHKQHRQGTSVSWETTAAAELHATPNAFTLRGENSEVALTIPEGSTGVYMTRESTNFTSYLSHIPNKECIISPLVEAVCLNHYNIVNKMFLLQIPHSVEKPQDFHFIRVRQFSSEGLEPNSPLKIQPDSPEEGFWVEQNCIKIQTRSFSKFICSICKKICSSKMKVFLLGAFRRRRNGTPSAHILACMTSYLHKMTEVRKVRALARDGT